MLIIVTLNPYDGCTVEKSADDDTTPGTPQSNTLRIVAGTISGMIVKKL